ncbi:unnamed protein product, partial [Ostreobium quekettii]
VTFDNMFAEEERDILIEASIPAVEKPMPIHKILQVTVSYFDPISHESVEQGPIVLSIKRTQGTQMTSPDTEVEVTRAIFNATQVIADALVQKERGQTGLATAALDTLLESIPESAVQHPRMEQLIPDVRDVRQELAKAK